MKISVFHPIVLGSLLAVSSPSNIVVEAFTPSRGRFDTTTTTTTTNALNMCPNKNDDDPTKNVAASIADTIQNIFTNINPLNDAKKKLVQALAGDYDAEEYKTKFQSYINDETNPIFMASFTK
mmetsp:Transcript_25871/g.32585  ORF Transcript_25871/g.32585 Transcript_25871/m.32585 type:complete len:123 (+) Transcript_25871:78-446(+)